MTIKRSPSELMQLNLLISVCDTSLQSSLGKLAAITNAEGRITNMGRNRWGEVFIQDYWAVAHIEILPKVPVYSPRPTVSFCNEAAASYMCPEGPTLPGWHRVARPHMLFGNPWTEILQDIHWATHGGTAMGSILGSDGLEQTLDSKWPEAPAVMLLHKGLMVNFPRWETKMTLQGECTGIA